MILKNVKLRERAEHCFQDALQFAIGALGWLVPDREASVRETSLEDGELTEQDLPPGLRDPQAALNRHSPDAE